jgi:SAM-dependent methyltransferase
MRRQETDALASSTGTVLRFAREEFFVDRLRGNSVLIYEAGFPPDSFDLVVCHNVIEHLTSVDETIRQFHHAPAPDGLLFIGAPSPESLFGFLTK